MSTDNKQKWQQLKNEIKQRWNRRKTQVHELPDLVKAAAILIGCNGLIGFWVIASPNMSLGSEPAVRTVAAAKPSPFEPIVDERTPPVTRAAKVKPVVIEDVLETADAGVPVYTASADEPADRYLSGDAMYRQLDRATEMPRMTAANYSRSTDARHVDSRVARPIGAETVVIR